MDKTTHEVRLANWTAIIERCQARPAGQTISDWCSESNINLKQYYYWQRKVRIHAAGNRTKELPALPSAGETTFAEIKIPYHADAAAPVPEPISGFKPDVLISKGNLVIGITNTVSGHVLDRIMQEVSNAG